MLVEIKKGGRYAPYQRHEGIALVLLPMSLIATNVAAAVVTAVDVAIV